MKVVIFVLVGFLFSSMSFGFDAEKYFKSSCKSCHTIGGGDTVGPDLAGLEKRRTADWVVKFMKYPEGMISGDPDEAGYEKLDPLAKKVYNLYKPTIMPDMNVTKEQVSEIFKYIAAQKKEPKGKILQAIK